MTRMAAHTIALLGAFCVVVGSGCTASVSEKPTVTPGGPGTRAGPDPDGVQEGDSVPELQQRLHTLVGDHAQRMDDAGDDVKACHDLCSLSVSICEVEVKLCDIADRHPQEASYQKLCREGQQECQAAQESCERCVLVHAEDGESSQPSE